MGIALLFYNDEELDGQYICMCLGNRYISLVGKLENKCNLEGLSVEY
jgi:hypothetical protein